MHVLGMDRFKQRVVLILWVICTLLYVPLVFIRYLDSCEDGFCVAGPKLGVMIAGSVFQSSFTVHSRVFAKEFPLEIWSTCTVGFFGVHFGLKSFDILYAL